jgi:hypothetical protein
VEALFKKHKSSTVVVLFHPFQVPVGNHGVVKNEGNMPIPLSIVARARETHTS